MIPDALDLGTVLIHNSPPDIWDWPATVDIQQLTMHPGAGLSFTTTPPIPVAWDYHMPGWGNPSAGDPGNILYTVWALVFVNFRWQGAGFIQMWKGRLSTGAPILSEWRNWAYDRNRWGEMVDYVPKPGDEMCFFLSAGNARNERGVTSRRERSNVVVIELPIGDSGVFTFQAETPQEPIPEPPAPLPVQDWAVIAKAVGVILEAQDANTDRILAAIQEARNSVTVYGPMIEQLVKFFGGKA